MVNTIHRRNSWGSSLWILTTKSTADPIFYIHQILEKKWKYNGTVQQLFIHFKAYNSVRREVMFNILIEFGIYKNGSN
jgi:hypothetical protein